MQRSTTFITIFRLKKVLFSLRYTKIQRDQQWLTLLAIKQLKNTGIFCLVIGTDRIF
jgi:hypothetical protein